MNIQIKIIQVDTFEIKEFGILKIDYPEDLESLIFDCYINEHTINEIYNVVSFQYFYNSDIAIIYVNGRKCEY